MSITDEFTRLQGLHDAGTLTDEEFAAAKAKVLNGSATAANADTLRQEVEQLKIQNAITQLDQDWETESQDYLQRGRYGSRMVPTTGGNIGGAVFVSILSLCMIGIGIAVPQVGGLALLGALSLILAIWFGINGCNKAVAYNQAYDRYQQRRNALSDQLNR